MCGDTLTLIDPLDSQSTGSAKGTLRYDNLFQAIEQSKHGAKELKESSELSVSARGILSANTITNKEELKIALKRVEQLWDAQYHSAEGNELHTLADLICAYEKPDWNSFFEQDPPADV